MEGGGDAAVQVLVQNLIDVTKGEISLIRDLKKNAQKLHDSLALIQSYLDDAEKKLITDEAVKTWLEKLDDVAFDAHNVLDELNYHLLSKKMKNIRRREKKKVENMKRNHWRDMLIHQGKVVKDETTLEENKVAEFFLS